MAKKQAKLQGKPDQTQLPKLVSSTYTDLKKRFQPTPKQDPALAPQSSERPRVRKLMDNPFEQKKAMAEDADKKSTKTFPSNNSSSSKKNNSSGNSNNRISEMKKRYSQLFSSTTQVMVGTLGSEKEEKEKKIEKPVEPMQVEEPTLEPSIPISPISIPKEENSPMFEKPKLSLLRRSKEQLDRSCEKMWRFSKEKINDISGNSGKPSKDDMQCYLLSHVLYDGQKTVANNNNSNSNSNVVAKKEPDWLDTLDEDMELEKGMFEDEYIKEMEKYLALFDSDEKKGKKKTSTKKKGKVKEEVKEPAVKLVTVEVNDLKKRFEVARNFSSFEQKLEQNPRVDFIAEQNVDKFKEMFETQNDSADSVPKTNVAVRRPGRLLSEDLLRKFDSPEMAEELKKQKEKEREERRLQRIAKLEEEKRRAEEERKRMEEEFKRIEEQRLETLKREEEERQRRAEEERQRKIDESRAKIAFEEMMKVEKEKKAQREKRDAQTKEQREKNEPAFKKRKVLDRIQHVFEKNMEEDNAKKVSKVGSIRGKADDLFSKDENSISRKNFQDSSLSGISSVLNKVKDKFEVKEEEPMTLSHGVSIKKKNIPGAETFALIELKQQKENLASANQLLRQNSSNAEEWSWKKKDPKQLAVETTIAMYGSSKEAPKKSDREKKRADQQQELLSDIKMLNSRFVKRDAIKEHEEKMKEYASFMAEIQEYLKEPVASNEEKSFKDDIQNYIELAAASASKKKQARKKSNEKVSKQEPMRGGDSIAEIILRLQEQTNSFESQKVNSEIGSSSIAQLRGSLQQKLDSGGPNNYSSKLFDAQGSSEVSKIRDKFESEENCVEQLESKSSYEWKYKKKSILELQKYLSDHGHLVPASVFKPLVAIEQNLAKEPSSSEDLEVNDEEDERVAEYNHFMEKVDQFLSAPDKSSEEIDFKTEIEKYLDLIEEPANEEEIKEQQKIYGTLKISRKPQKLNLSQLVFEKSLIGIDDLDDDEERQSLRPKDSKFIKDMQLKLVGDAAKDSPKDEVIVHTVGTSRLTKEFEKLGKAREVTLLTAPKIVTKKTAEEMTAAAVTADSKPISTTAWKWKQKDVNELYHHIKENYEVVPPAIQERQRILLETETCLEQKRAALEHDASLMSVAMLKKMEEDRDKELEHFLNDVQQFLGNERDNEVKNVSSKSVKQKQKKETIETKPKVLELTGNVSSIRNLLENQNNDFELEEDVQDKPKIGKLKSDFLQISKVQEKITSNKFADPVVSSLDANRIKSKLVNQYFNKKEEPKTLFSAPKTKLQNFIPQEDKMATASELGGLLRQKRSNSTTTKPSKEKVSIPVKPIINELPKPEIFEFKPRVEPVEPVKYKSPYAHIQSEEERKAAILAKYGVKPRPLRNSDSSSSLSSEEDEVEIKKKLIEQKEQLKEVYGLNDIKERRRDRRSEKENSANSLYSLRNVLAQLRTTRSVHSNNGSRLNLAESSSNDAIYKSDADLSAELKGTCSHTRAIFERLNNEGETVRENQPIERSATFSNVKSLFDATDSPTEQSPRHSGLYKPVSNRSFSNVKSVFEESEREANLNRPSNVFSPANRSSNNIERSSSFHKFLGAFEAGRRLDDEEESSDDDSDDEQVSSRPRIASANAGSQKSLIQAELDEIRSSTRLQSVFRINRPSSMSNRPTLNSKFGNSSENLDLDEKTLHQVSTTRYLI